MAAQQILFAETIMAMKKAMRRNTDASDSDESIDRPTNRGNKLKRKAKYVQEGRLDSMNGPPAFKKRIDYNGYNRYIVGVNPPRFDEDGDVVDDDDDDMNEDAGSFVEENPYAEIKLERLLAPLNHPSELSTHPTMSVPYYSSALPDLIRQANMNVRKGKEMLYDAKRLFMQFNGDPVWVPCGEMQTEYDDAILHGPPTPSDMKDEDTTFSAQFAWDGSDPDGTQAIQEGPGTAAGNKDGEPKTQLRTQGHAPQSADAPNGNTVNRPAATSAGGVTDSDTAIVNAQQNGTDASEGTGPHRMTTRLRSSAQNSRAGSTNGRNGNNVNHTGGGADAGAGAGSTSPTLTTASSTAEPAIHPFYLAPPHPFDPTPTFNAGAAMAAATSNPGATAAMGGGPALDPAVAAVTATGVVAGPVSGRSGPTPFNLPPAEAEETRRMLLLYVQKMGEAVRGAEAMLDLLLKADRMRNEVLRMCRAEEHVGECSDGEDWVDPEEWGLEEGKVQGGLVKGREEEEDGTGGGGGDGGGRGERSGKGRTRGRGRGGGD
ncbi:RXT2-like protein [Lineolata rhizophorae]|uniref:RXT2-like protein n=1 Tax=Lineolata rhizophorae TaxID=578093 RepID=A0A6A6PA57_9PEZI|nr:RXT2-like protein [Lineolata rhizophorae]